MLRDASAPAGVGITSQAMQRVDGVDYGAGRERLGTRQHNAATVAHGTGHPAVKRVQTGLMAPPRPQERGGGGRRRQLYAGEYR